MTTATPDVAEETDTDTTTLRLPPYAVVLHNDDYNSMGFVAGVLQKVFKYDYLKCVKIMMTAHVHGRAVAWVGPRELAELKAEQVESCGPNPAVPHARKLGVTVEPV